MTKSEAIAFLMSNGCNKDEASEAVNDFLSSGSKASIKDWAEIFASIPKPVINDPPYPCLSS